MNPSTWKQAAEFIVQKSEVNQQPSAAATADSTHLESLPLSTLSADDSGPPQVIYGPKQQLASSTPWATVTPSADIQSTDPYCQIIPGMTEHLYPTIIADGSLSAPASYDCSTLHRLHLS